MAKITRTVNQQYENYCDVKAGDLEVSNQLIFTAPLSEAASDSAAKIVRGSVVSLNAEGKFKLGCPKGSGNKYPMAMFSRKNAFDPDVMTGAVGAKTGEVLATSLVGGRLPAYVATGGFELETSEFDAAADYTVNTALKAADTGKVTAAGSQTIYGNETIVGIVSRVPFRSKASFNVNGEGNNRLCFWTVFFPGKA
jgi:hypothetical protein